METCLKKQREYPSVQCPRARILSHGFVQFLCLFLCKNLLIYCTLLLTAVLIFEHSMLTMKQAQCHKLLKFMQFLMIRAHPQTVAKHQYCQLLANGWLSGLHLTISCEEDFTTPLGSQFCSTIDLKLVKVFAIYSHLIPLFLINDIQQDCVQSAANLKRLWMSHEGKKQTKQECRILICSLLAPLSKFQIDQMMSSYKFWPILTVFNTNQESVIWRVCSLTPTDSTKLPLYLHQKEN